MPTGNTCHAILRNINTQNKQFGGGMSENAGRNKGHPNRGL